MHCQTATVTVTVSVVCQKMTLRPPPVHWGRNYSLDTLEFHSHLSLLYCSCYGSTLYWFHIMLFLMFSVYQGIETVNVIVLAATGLHCAYCDLFRTFSPYRLNASVLLSP